MLPNTRFWAHYIRQVNIRGLEGLRQAVFAKVLPSFESITAEADTVADAEFNRLGQMPAFDDSYVDMGDLAEQAMDAGIEFYETMFGVRQALMNVISASIYHLFEQQVLVIHRRELLRGEEEHQERLFNVPEALRRLKDYGIECTSFKSWPKLIELQLLANTVKHAEGRSSRELQGLRPDLFISPLLREPELDLEAKAAIKRSIFVPLAGEDIYVTPDELAAYFDAVVAFWNELAESLEQDRGEC